MLTLQEDYPATLQIRQEQTRRFISENVRSQERESTCLLFLLPLTNLEETVFRFVPNIPDLQRSKIGLNFKIQTKSTQTPETFTWQPTFDLESGDELGVAAAVVRQLEP